jgi:hypothetical protein
MPESTNPVQEALYRNRRKRFRINGGCLRVECSATAVLAMALVGLAATWIPAQPALSIEPSMLMRDE